MGIKILGIDPSTKMGLVVLDFKRGSGIVETKLKKETTFPKLRGMERLAALGGDLLRIITEHQPTYIYIEGYSFASKHNREIAYALGTVLRYFMWQEDWDYTEIAPPTLKKFVTGKGNCAKDLVLKEVYKNWGFDTDNDNIADAYGLAMLGLYTYLEILDGKGGWLKSKAKHLNYI